MDILGIGPLELVFILIIALIVLGPKDMVKAGRTIGKFLRQIVTSPTWHAVTRTSNELRNLPNKLIRDAGLEEDLKQIEDVTKNVLPSNLNQDLSKWQQDINSWTTPPAEKSSAKEELTNSEDSAEIPGELDEDLVDDQQTRTIAPPEINQAGEGNSPDPVAEDSQEQVD